MIDDTKEEVLRLKVIIKDLKLRNSVLRQRPDLPVDRLPAIREYEKKIIEAKFDGMIEVVEHISKMGCVYNFGKEEALQYATEYLMAASKEDYDYD